MKKTTLAIFSILHFTFSILHSPAARAEITVAVYTNGVAVAGALELPDGETADVVATLSGGASAVAVELLYSLDDPKGHVSAATNSLAMSTTNGVDWAGFIPVLPAGTLTWFVRAHCAGGASEDSTAMTAATGAGLTYDRFHDMKGIPGIHKSATANEIVADYGWQQDKTIGGNNATNFYAYAPNGSQWKASGVVWARAATRANRTPVIGPVTQLPISGSMLHPVLWIANVPPEYSPEIRSPKLENGLGTISFDARISEGLGKIKLQVAYTESEPSAFDWNDVQEYAFSGTMADFYVTNIVNDVKVTYARLLRSEMNTGNTSFSVAWIGIDNLCLTPPTPDIVMEASAEAPDWPGAGETVAVRCAVSNVCGRIPAINRALAVRYAWADPGAPPSSVQYAEAAMARAGATNGLDIYEARVPCELREEFRHVVECRFEGYYLLSPAENGMASPAILYAGGRTNDPVAAAAAPAVARPWGAVLSGTPTLTVAGGANLPPDLAELRARQREIERQNAAALAEEAK